MSLLSTSDTRAWLREGRAVAVLAVPLALTHLSYMAIMLTDVIMMGWIGTHAIAAGTLARDFYWVLVAFAMGVLTGATPLMAQGLGARRSQAIRPIMRNAAWLSLLLTVPIFLVVWWAGTILVLLGQEQQISEDGQSYLRYLVWGLLPALWFVVLTEFLAAHSRPRAALVVTVISIALNALLDYMLMFGNFGAPEMGLEGAGVTSIVVNWFMFLMLLGFVLTDPQFRQYRLLAGIWRSDSSVMAEIARVGSPIAVTEISEMGLFFVTTLLMGLISVDALAAHAVTAQCYALVFMIPIGLMQAGAVRVGRYAGAKDGQGLVRAGWAAMALTGITVLIPAAFFWLGGIWLAGFILDPAVSDNRMALELAVLLLGVAAFCMIADAIQITARGALQGLKDTVVPMMITIAMSWGMGLPVAVVLGLFLNFGGPGIWAGMGVAMAGAMLLLARRFHRQSKKFGRNFC